MIYVLPPFTPPIGERVFVTSGSQDGNRTLSPFLLGPVPVGTTLCWSQNVENAWQFSKVYPEHDAGGYPTKEWFTWAQAGWNANWAKRYPMGKGAVPAYTWWGGKALDYIEARKHVYVPVYAAAVRKYQPKALFRLGTLADRGDLTIVDYDAYNHHDLEMSLDDVLNDPTRKMGHGFVLAMMLEGIA